MTDTPQTTKKKKKKKANPNMSVGECVRLSLQQYFEDLDQEVPSNLYAMVVGEVEGPMLEVVMKHTNNNQSQTAEILGLNRGTLRKKLKEYHLI